METKMPTAGVLFIAVAVVCIGSLHIARGQQPITHTPGLCDGKYLNVSLDLDFFGIISVDSSHETIVYNLMLKMQWLDESLSWPVQNSSGDVLTKYRLPTDICFPDLLIEGSLQSTLQGVSAHHIKREVSISHRGLVTVHYPFVYTGYCQMALTEFPFDTQHCALTMFSPSRSVSALDLNTGDEVGTGGGDGDSLLSSEEWVMSRNMSAVRSERRDLLDDETVAAVRYAFTMSRRSGYYLLHLSLPSTLVALIATVGFFTPYASDDKRQEKTRLGMSALVALSVQMMIVARSLSVTGDVSLLTRYNVFLLGVVLMGALISTTLVAVQHQGILYQRNIPPCLRRLCFSCLPTLLCVSRREQDKRKKVESSSNGRENLGHHAGSTEVMELSGAGVRPSVGYRGNSGTSITKPGTPRDKTTTIVTTPEMKSVDKDQLKKDWIYLTLVIDRLCLTVFLICIAATIAWFTSHIKNI